MLPCCQPLAVKGGAVMVRVKWLRLVLYFLLTWLPDICSMKYVSDSESRVLV